MIIPETLEIDIADDESSHEGEIECTSSSEASSSNF